MPRTCSPFSTVTEAALILKDEGLDIVPVVDLGKPVGIVTDRELALGAAGQADLGQQPVSSIMDREIPTTGPDTPLDQVLKLMGDAGTRDLLVVDADGLLLGAISRAGLAERFPDGAMTAVSDSQDFVEVDQP